MKVSVLDCAYMEACSMPGGIGLLAGRTKRLDPASGWWRSVLEATDQPERIIARDGADIRLPLLPQGSPCFRLHP